MYPDFSVKDVPGQYRRGIAKQELGNERNFRKAEINGVSVPEFHKPGVGRLEICVDKMYTKE